MNKPKKQWQKTTLLLVVAGLVLSLGVTLCFALQRQSKGITEKEPVELQEIPLKETPSPVEMVAEEMPEKEEAEEKPVTNPKYDAGKVQPEAVGKELAPKEEEDTDSILKDTGNDRETMEEEVLKSPEQSPAPTPEVVPETQKEVEKEAVEDKADTPVKAPGIPTIEEEKKPEALPETGSAHEHSWVFVSFYQKPTCSDGGLVNQICSQCGETQTTGGTPTGEHVFRVETAGDCCSAEVVICRDCNHREVREKDPENHMDVEDGFCYGCGCTVS